MKGSIRVATILGIPIQIHWTFSLLILWLVYDGSANGLSPAGIKWYLLLMAALFVCVLLHEYGHALAARRYGIRTHDITLSPIGGLARLDRLPEKPKQELIVAIAGPLVNVVIACIIYIVLKIILGKNISATEDTIAIFENPANFFPLLFILNIMLVVFNLIPAFPMDGGRMFRALLALKFGRVKATRWAARLGQLIAILFLVFAIYNEQPMLGLISIFIFSTAMMEYNFVKMDAALNNVTVSNILRQHYTILYLSDTMEHAMSEAIKGVERDFLVFDDWTQQRYGSLPESAIIHAVKNKNLSAKIEKYVSASEEYVHTDTPLKVAYAKMRSRKLTILPVYGMAHQLIGVVDMRAMDYFVALRNT
ncbi:MAG: site-2 protease family protein [Saprospiraceae bacterium]|nr:site-2 protease family protein [Saprospiraceae bacterium]MBP7680064.1 site-2 protease family protein [Saprospiraceae bacterium]